MIVIGPFIFAAIMIVLLVHLFRKSLSKDKLVASKNRKVLVALIASGLLVFAVGVGMTWFSEYSSNRHAQNRNFKVYALDSKDVNTEYLRPAGEITIQFARIRLETPQGKIDVRQTGFDETINRLFQKPDKCELDELNDYVNIFGKNDNLPAVATQACTQVYAQGDRAVYRPKDVSKILNDTPFLAVIGNTFMVFKAYSSTFGDFQGDISEAEEYIVDFVKNAQVIDNEQLGL